MTNVLIYSLFNNIDGNNDINKHNNDFNNDNNDNDNYNNNDNDGNNNYGNMQWQDLCNNRRKSITTEVR